MEERNRIAVFIDFDNIEIGVKNTLGREFDVSIVLEALKERGEVLTKIAYADWTHHGDMSRSFSQHGVQMVQRHPGPRGDKNGADINLALDALEMALTKPHIDAFAIVSGDSDFISLVEKLKQYNKVVFVVGGRAFTSTILQKNCREFINYESLMTPVHSHSQQRHGRGGPPQRVPRAASTLPLSGVMPLLHRALEVLARREVQPQLGLLKSTMLQLDSSFTERDYGTSSFRQFVEMLDKARLVRTHKEHGHYLISLPSQEEEARVEESLFKREDALSILHRALRVIDENDLWGKLDFNAVREYVERLEPGFDEKRYGFAQFAELLNYAQDLSLVRLEPDASEVLRVEAGSAFTATRAMAPAVSRREEREPQAASDRERQPQPETAFEPEAEAIEAEEEETVGGEAEAAEAPSEKAAPKKRVYRRRSRARSQTPRKPRKTQPES